MDLFLLIVLAFFFVIIFKILVRQQWILIIHFEAVRLAANFTKVLTRFLLIFYIKALNLLNFIWNLELVWAIFRIWLYESDLTFCLLFLTIINININLISSYWNIDFMRFLKMCSQSIFSNKPIALIALNFQNFLLFFLFCLFNNFHFF